MGWGFFTSQSKAANRIQQDSNLRVHNTVDFKSTPVTTWV